MTPQEADLLFEAIPPTTDELRSATSMQGYLDRVRDIALRMEQQGTRTDALDIWDFTHLVETAAFLWQCTRGGRCRSTVGVTGRVCGARLLEADQDGMAECTEGHRQRV